jgi:hypothetical protein
MPKTFKNLYPRICAFENLYLAHRKARRGGKRRRAAVAEFEHNLGENLRNTEHATRNTNHARGQP